MIRSLPIVPPAVAGELLGSWMQRAASVYDLSAHQLMDQWLPVLGGPAASRQSLDARVAAAGTTSWIAERMSSTPHAIQAMLPDRVDWLVATDTDIAVCPHCLLDDDTAGVPRFRRRIWAECWRIRCATHRTLLVNMPDWRTDELRPWRVVKHLRRNACGKIVRLGRRGSTGTAGDPPVRIAIDALVQMEAVIGAALAGRRPHAPSWGEVSAAEFLTIVQDATAFALSRFDPANARPFCLIEPFRYTDSGAVRCFDRLPCRSTCADPGTSPVMVDIAHAGDVGLRRCALFWARELMHCRTVRPWLAPELKRDRHQRQKTALELQNQVGIDWLVERVKQWPRRYRDQRWRI